MKARLEALGLLAAVVTSAASAGCGPGFEPPTRLNSPRVLAIQSDPVAPAPGETTTLSAKTYTPTALPALNYDWSWCPVTTNPGVACPFTDDDVSALAGVPVVLHLGNAETATLTHNIPAPLLEMLCNGMPGFPTPDCTDGFPIQVRLFVCTDSDAANCVNADNAARSDVAVEATRRLRLRFRDADQANINPAITGLHALITGMDAPADLTGMPSPTLVRKKETVIIADVNPDDPDVGAQRYFGRDNDNLPAEVSERLTLSWFVESGDTNHQRTGPVVTGNGNDRIKWTPAYLKDEKDSLRADKNMSRVIVIIRDEREGASWIEGNSQLVEETTP